MSSDPEVVLLHNPRCSKSRATKALLEERGIAFQERPYLEQPLDESELRALEQALDRPLREWVRRGEAAWKEAGLGDDPSADELRAAVASHPVLMERPIVRRGDEARVGRPPTAVLELF